MDEINPSLLLTAAISARASEFWKYDFEKDQQHLDWYNVMTYDFHGSWESRTGHHTNLLSSPADPDWEKNSLDHTIKYLLDSAGVSSDKIVPGAAFFGKSWQDVDSINLGLYQSGKPDTIWNRVRFNNYLDFSGIINSGYQCYWDYLAMSAWLYNHEEKVFFTYDDIRSIALKSRYVEAYDLRGLMFWEITGDDTSGNLVNTIYNRNMPDIEIRRKKESIVPAINILKPFSSTLFFAGSNILLNTNIEDNIISIVKVEYFIDEHSIGYNTIYPFNWIWFNAEEGEHKISVVATEKDGTILFSEPVEINVKGK
jgi:GH18 family chitinase